MKKKVKESNKENAKALSEARRANATKDLENRYAYLNKLTGMTAAERFKLLTEENSGR